MLTSIAALKNLIDIGEKVKNWANKKDDSEALSMSRDFLAAILELQTLMIQLQQENAELLEKVGVVQKRSDLRLKLVRRESYYEFAEPVDGYGQGPFCLVCTDREGIPIGIPVNSVGHLDCSHCKSSGWLEGAEKNFIAKRKAKRT